MLMRISLPFATTMWFLLATPIFLLHVAHGESVVSVGCTEAMILDGTCSDACICPCANGLGVLVDPAGDDPDCDKPIQSVCMDPVVAYEFVVEQNSGAW